MPPKNEVPPIQHYENFPVASFLCPPHLRAPIGAIYHFARTADDIADEGTLTSAERLKTLAEYRGQLQLVAGKGDVPSAFDARWRSVFLGLKAAIEQHQLPQSLLEDLLDAFVQDVEKTRDFTESTHCQSSNMEPSYASDAELLDYCRRSANPVGRLLLHLYGVSDPAALAQSDAICTALQLINFWQDPSVDIPRGRHYFTGEMQQQAQVSMADICAQRVTPQTTRMVRQCVDAARARMLTGAPLVHRLPGRAGWELRLVVQGGLRILDKIETLGFRTLRERPQLNKWDFVPMLWRAFWM
jgi:squalene synthase HpnC